MINKNKSSMNEGMFSQIDQIRQDSNDVRDFVKKVFSDKEFKSMSKDTDFIKYLKSIYEGTVLDEEHVKFSNRTSNGTISTGSVQTSPNESIINEVSNPDVRETKFGNLRVTIGDTTYEVAYSADGWNNPYGLGVVGKDDNFLKMNTPKAKKLWKQLEPIISKWKRRNESVVNEGNNIGHYERVGNQTIVDSNFVNNSKGIVPNSELVHLGMGDFALKSPSGNIEFNRSGKLDGIGQDFVGRPHRMTDDKNGKLVDVFLKLMLKKKKAILSMSESVVNETVSDKKVDAKVIANKMRKNQSTKDFANKVEKMGKVSHKDLEKILPDYVPGGLITNLFKESVNEANKPGDRLTHKHNPKIEIELIEPTNKGWKVYQIEKGKKKIAYFDKQDISGNNSLFESLNEAASLEAMGIAALTGTRGSAVEDFINKHNLDGAKLFKSIKSANLKGRLNFASALAGKDGNSNQKLTIKLFKKKFNESVSEGKDDFMARHGKADITLKKGYKHHTEDELTKLYDKVGKLTKDKKIKKVDVVFEVGGDIKEDKFQISQLKKKVNKSETKFYDVLSTIENKMGSKKYRLFIEKSLKDFDENPNQSEYRTNASIEEKLFQLS